MADFLSIEVTGAAELQAGLLQAVQRLQQPRDLMQALGGVLVANIQRRFDTKTDPSGQRWAPWADATRAGYDRADTQRTGKNAGQVVRRGTLLERTGQMRASLVANATDNQVEVGMSRPTNGGAWSIPLLHETGTARMPRRGIFLADPDAGTLGAGDEADLQAELVGFLDDIFGAA